MARIRDFRAGDEAALAEICLRTALAGADATGVLDDDGIWAAISVLPYVARHPDLAFVVEEGDDHVVGYVVATPDTRAFETWFRDQWWPPLSTRWPEPVAEPSAEASLKDRVLCDAYRRGPGAEPYGDTYPAHLHIDLLPEAQGQGWGRRLMAHELDALRAAGASGVHLVADAANTGALAFYPRVGFVPIPSHPGVQAFARDL